MEVKGNKGFGFPMKTEEEDWGLNKGGRKFRMTRILKKKINKKRLAKHFETSEGGEGYKNKKGRAYRNIKRCKKKCRWNTCADKRPSRAWDRWKYFSEKVSSNRHKGQVIGSMEKDKKKKEANRKYKKTSITEELESGNSANFIQSISHTWMVLM